MKIRSKILISILLIVVLITGLSVTYFFSKTRHVLKNEVIHHLKTTANDRAHHLVTYLQQNIERLNLVTSRNKLRDLLWSYNQAPSEGLKSEMREIIDSAAKSVEDIERICVVGLDGEIIISTDQRFEGKDVSEKSFFQEAQTSNFFDLAQENDRDEIYFSGPFILDNRIIGVGIVVVSSDEINNIIGDRVGLGDTGEIMIAVEKQENIFFISEKLFSEFEMQNNCSDQEQCSMKVALSGKEVVLDSIQDYKGKDVLAVTKYIDLGGIGLVAKIDTEEVLDASYNQLRKEGYTIFSILFFITFLISSFMSLFLSRPLKKLEEGIKKVESGNLNFRFEINSGDEIQKLANSFNKMISSLQKSRKYIDRKVQEQTIDIQKKSQKLEDQQEAVLNVLEDVEEEKEKVKKQKKKFLEIFNNVNDALYLHTIEKGGPGRFLEVNDKACEMLGYSREEFLKMTPAEINSKESAKRVLNIMKKLMTEGEFKWEGVHISKKGEKIPISFSSHLFEIDGKKRIITVARDIRNRKKREKQIKEERDKIKAILNSLGEGVFVVNQDLEIVLFNPAAEKISGYSSKEAVGKPYKEVLNFVFEKDKNKVNDRFIKDAFKTGKTQNMSNHTLLIGKDGEEIPVADSAAPLKGEKGEVIGCVVVFRDNSRRRAIDKAKTEFVSLASHQLRTPLSIIRWYIEALLGGDLGKINEEQKEYLEEINEGNQRMIDLVNSLLNVSRLEMGKLDINPTELDIVEIAKKTIKQFRLEIKEKQINFIENYDEIPPIKLDKDLLGIVFQNLISNAIKYSSEKGKVQLDILRQGENVEIAIQDNGIGIPKKQQGKIFEKLFRADNVKTKNINGTGLGLYLVKKILDHCNCKIWFESKENEGTTFFVRIPLKGVQKKKEGSKQLV
jgi:PAS domain S-box-containing protein